MIFGSKTGYGKVDLILQPWHLQGCDKIDVKVPSKNRSTSEPSLISLRAIEPDHRPQKPRASAKAGFIEENRGGAPSQEAVTLTEAKYDNDRYGSRRAQFDKKSV